MAKKKMGRPRIEWSPTDYKHFEGLCAIQCTEEEIASVMGVSVDTVSRRVQEHYNMTFAEVYKRYSAPGKAALRRTQFDLAKRNATMAIWLGKQWLGQRDEVDLNASGDVDVNITVDYGD